MEAHVDSPHAMLCDAPAASVGTDRADFGCPEAETPTSYEQVESAGDLSSLDATVAGGGRTFSRKMMLLTR